MEKQQSCEERIADRLASALEDLSNATAYQFQCEACGHEFMSADDDSDCPECEAECEQVKDPDESREEYLESVLEITPMHLVIRVGLSWGGPADGFTLYCDPDTREIEKVEYYFQDWFDGAKRGLSGSALDMVRDMFQPYVENYE